MRVSSLRARLTSVAFAGLLVAALIRGRCSSPLGSVSSTASGAPELGGHVGPSPLGLAAQYVTLDISYIRWLWWPVILYLFWGMAYVCDVYFVRTIEVISERFQIPDDVAGATLMALGCNGPELALNTIAIFKPSNIGVGAVIGGEVFNVLVIIGTAIIATPDSYLPLKLRPFMFFRDVVFYVVSVGLLYWVLQDGSISRLNAVVLILGAVCYIMTVVFSSKLSSLLARVQPRRLVRSTTATISKAFISKAFSRKITNWIQEGMDSDSEEPEADPKIKTQWQRARGCAEPGEGSVLSVRVDIRNRLMDRGHRSEERYVVLCDGALLVSAAPDPTEGLQKLRRKGSTLVFERETTARDHHWHHGGLVNQPTFQDTVDLEARPGDASAIVPVAGADSPITSLTRPLLNEPAKQQQPLASGQRPAALTLPGLRDAPWEVIPLEDVLYCDAQGDGKHFTLHVHQHTSDLGRLITLEFSTKEPAVLDAWVGSLSRALKEQRRLTAEAPPAKSCTALLMEWVEWLQFPVKFCLKLTIPDMDDPKLQGWYPVSFTMSMVWLAVFAFSVVTACDGIHEDFGISNAVLGFTVAAAGTSFPNVFSGMVVARQGKTSMAIANALGANVQNVFLALAIPWAVQTFMINGGPFPMAVDNLMPAVVECMVTLMPVVLIFACNASSLPWWSGSFFLVTYVVYLVFALGQQTTGCASWPLPC